MNLIEQIARDRNLVENLEESARTRYGYTHPSELIVSRARDLHASGILSRHNVETILNLQPRCLEGFIEVEPNSRIGGRLSAETIPSLLDAFFSYRGADFPAAKVALLACVPQTSLRMAARLAEIPYSTAHRWIPERL